MKLQCLIVDDEPIAQKILENYILKVDFLELAAKCSNAIDALQVLHNQTIDIIFLDIKMPTLSGIEMLKSTHPLPNVILTTAYSEYAVQSYELNVKDYLLKPITFERFLKAVNKTIFSETDLTENKSEMNTTNKFMFFKADKKVYKFYFYEIIFFEGYGNYVKVYSLNKKPILVLDKLNNLGKILSSNDFIRVHKSYIVNLSLVKEISGNRIIINNIEIPIGQSYKEGFWDKVRNK